MAIIKNDFPENMFLVPVRALRDEGTSYHYLQPSRFIGLDQEIVDAIEEMPAHSRDFSRE